MAAATRISPDYLQALEEDSQLTAFPAPMYARAFLRSYARHLGLNEDSLLAAFAVRHGAGDPPPRAVIPVEEPPSERRVPLLRTLPGGLRSLTSSISSVLGPRRGGGRRLEWIAGRLGRAPASRPRVLIGRAPRRAGGGSPDVPVVISTNGGSSHGSSRSGTRARRARPSRRVPRGAVVALAAVPLIVLLIRTDLLGSAGPDPAATLQPRPSAPAGPELPRGGRQIFPDFRVVAYYGAARTERLGILGIGPEAAARRLLKQAAAYDRPNRPVLPAFELIGTLATAAPGGDGKYRVRMSDSIVGGYLDAARANRMLFVIDVQPGRADFLPEVKFWERYLAEPDVGLALDPEWHVAADEVPGGGFVGSTDAATVNRVGDWLADIVRRHNLPQKLFIIHQFTADMIADKGKVKTWPELATVFDIDGFGNRQTKLSKWKALTSGYGNRYYNGIKLFYDYDPDLMQPRDIFRLRPKVDLIVYQ